MAKYCHPDNLDAALNAIAAANEMHACVGQPATFADVSTATRASVAVTGADFTLAAGDTSGRKVVVAAKSGVSVSADGTVDHVALVDTANSKLLYVTTSNAQGVTTGSTVNFPSWDIEIADPA